MFGPYEIACEGRRFFGNVALRELHVFAHGANAYVVDVKRLSARGISPELAAVLTGPALNFGGLISETLMQTLRDLDLLADTAPPSPPAARGAEPENAPGPAEFFVAHIGLFLTRKCNMRCVYCYGDPERHAQGEPMDLATATRAVDWLFDNSGSAREVGLCFFGGEPLLNFPLVRAIVPYARQKAVERGKKITLGMTTNGSLLTDESIAFIRNENISLLISFDGPPEVHDSQRPFADGSGSYDTVAANVRKLLKVLPDVPARATLHGDADPARVRRGMKQAGFKICHVAPASPTPPDGPDSHAGAPVADDRMEALLRTMHGQEIDELLLAVRERAIDKNFAPPALGAMHGLVTGQKQHYGCGVGKAMAAIDVNGDIYPCHRFAGLASARLGNIADYRAGSATDYHRAHVDTLPECRPCWARYLCGGGCLYHNKAATGDMRRPDGPVCRAKKAMFERLVHTHCRLDPADREYLRAMLEGFSPQRRHP